MLFIKYLLTLLICIIGVPLFYLLKLYIKVRFLFEKDVVVKKYIDELSIITDRILDCLHAGIMGDFSFIMELKLVLRDIGNLSDELEKKSERLRKETEALKKLNELYNKEESK